MTIPLKYNTAAQVIPLGFALDSTDGNTEETGLTISNTDIWLWKAGATTLANKNSGGATHMQNGVYYCTLDATDSNAYGPLLIYVHESGALALKQECVVMEPDAYDALYAASGTGHIESDVRQLGGAAQSATDLKDFADAGYDPATDKVQGVVLVDTTTANSDMVAAAPTAAANADAVWDEATSGHVAGGSFGAQAGTDIDAILLDTAEIGAAGAGLTVLPTKAQMDTAHGLLATPAQVATELGTYDSPTNTEMVAAFTEVKGATWAVTDTLEAIRNRGDSAWITATGFATHAAADIWAVATRLLTAGTNIVLAKGTGVTGFTDLSAAQVNTEVATALAAIDLDHFIQVTAGVEEPTDGTYLDQIMHKDVNQTYSDTTDSLEAIRDTAPLGTAMRGTDSAALAAVATEARLAELDAANIPTNVDTLSTRLSAIRAGYLDELGAANVPADLDTLIARLTAARAGYLDALNGHTAQTGDNYARLGAPAGVSVSADVAAVKTDSAAVLLDTGTDGVVISTATAQTIADEGAKRKPSDVEATAVKASYAWINALMSQCHKVTFTDDGDNTATLTLYKSDGVTTWGTVAGLTTAASGDVVTGVEDTV